MQYPPAHAAAAAVRNGPNPGIATQEGVRALEESSDHFR